MAADPKNLLKLQKHLSDAHNLALKMKNELPQGSIFADSILSLKNRLNNNAPSAPRKVAGASRAIAFTAKDFEQKKTQPVIAEAVDEFKEMSIDKVKVIAKEMGLAIRGRDKQQLVDEILFQRAGNADLKPKKVVKDEEE